MARDKIIIKGAREHNLKNINLELPRDKMIVFTGLSGSGKSSLAFDTIFAEGQRRYIESLSAYARQFLGRLDKPDVDEIEGLSPAISIDQKSHSHNPRSTVATITEIYDYLRVLFARAGKPHCPKCGREIQKLTKEEIVDVVIDFLGAKPRGSNSPTMREVESRTAGKELVILAPAVRGRKGEYYQMLYDFLNAGFSEVRIDGQFFSLRERIELSRYRQHNIDLVVDRMPAGLFQRMNKAASPERRASLAPEERDNRLRLAEAIEHALKYGNDVVTVKVGVDTRASSRVPVSPKQQRGKRRGISRDSSRKLGMTEPNEISLSAKFTCPHDGFSFPEIEPRLFSFNSPYGACPVCHGLGTEDVWSENICKVCAGKRLKEESLNVLINGKNIATVTAMSIEEAYKLFQNLDLKSQNLREIAELPLKEIINRLKFMIDVGLDYLTLDRKAGTLSGGEAQRIRLASQIGSRLVGTLYILDEPTIGLHQKDNAKLIKTLHDLRDLGNTIIVVEHDEETIRESDYLVDIGPGAGVHGGKIVAQGPIPEILKPVIARSETTKQSDASWRHPEQSEGSRLRHKKPGSLDKLGTTFRARLPRSRWSLATTQGETGSLTLQYLRGDEKIEFPDKRRKVEKNHDYLKIRGAKANNLKDIDLDIPLRRFVAVTGVSGSGKSSLVYDVLYKGLANRFYQSGFKEVPLKAMLGMEYVNRVVNVDQSPIGRTPRSNPATYVGAWTYIRDLFASTEDARVRGYKPGRFSFNVPGGRCESCEGHGTIAIEMHFLPTVYVTCDVCKGKRFDRETLEVEYRSSAAYSAEATSAAKAGKATDGKRGKNIYDVLQMTIEEAAEFFEDIPWLDDRLSILEEVGLGYLTLGQSATTLSGGEAQRVKLAAELGKRDTRRTLYLLDEPTTGLHFEDVKKLLEVLQKLVDRGNTVIVIEHNLDVIKSADWVIDLGPEGGERGGEVVAVGTPEQIARKAGSCTGQYLRKVLS